MRTFTPAATTRHRVQSIRTLAFLAAWGAGQREAVERDAAARLRVHARIRRLSDEVLADPAFALARTEAIPRPRGET